MKWRVVGIFSVQLGQKYLQISVRIRICKCDVSSGSWITSYESKKTVVGMSRNQWNVEDDTYGHESSRQNFSVHYSMSNKWVCHGFAPMFEDIDVLAAFYLCLESGWCVVTELPLLLEPFLDWKEFRKLMSYTYISAMVRNKRYLNNLDCLFRFITVNLKVGYESGSLGSKSVGPPLKPK